MNAQHPQPSREPCPHRVQVLVVRRRHGDVIARCVACGRIVSGGSARQEGQR